MAVSEDILVRLRAVGQAAFVGAMDEAAGSIGKISTQSDKAGASTKRASDTAEKGAPKWHTMARRLGAVAGGAAALYAAKRGIESAVTATEQLGSGTLRLMRTTGMDARQASQWAEITKVRGIETRSFQRGLVALSKQMESARGGGKTATDTFKQLGVSMDAVRSGNTQQVMLQMADGFKAMKNPAQRAALAQKLLARQGQELLPLFASGSGAIKEQLAAANALGASMGGKTAQQIKEQIVRQRELKMATDGLKVSLGTALLPAIDAVTKALVWLTMTFQPLLRSGTAVKIMIGLVTAAFVAYKIAVVAAMLASIGLNAVWLLIPLAILAIAAALYMAYRRVGWFRRAVQNVFGWIKSNWPLLVSILAGPVGIAVMLIVRNFGRIKGAVGSVIAWVRRIPGAVRGAMSAAAHAAGSVVSHFYAVGRRIVEAIANGIRSSPGAIVNAVRGAVESLPGKAAHAALGALGFQHGGVMPHTGMALVGEAGPELLQLPGGSRITPLPAPSVAGAPRLGAGAGAATQTTAHFYLDRRLLATAVAQDTSDRKARR